MAVPTLTLTTDKDLYSVNDPIVVEAQYTDATSAPVNLTITGTFVDEAGRAVTSTTTTTVTTAEQQTMTGRVTDSWGDAYVEQDNANGVAHYTSILTQPEVNPLR